MQESTDLFSELIKKVNQTGIQVGELLSTHEASLGSRVEGQINRMEQEVAQLRWKSQELNRLADMKDHICFLKVVRAAETDSRRKIKSKVYCQKPLSCLFLL